MPTAGLWLYVPWVHISRVQTVILAKERAAYAMINLTATRASETRPRLIQDFKILNVNALLQATLIMSGITLSLLPVPLALRALLDLLKLILDA